MIKTKTAEQRKDVKRKRIKCGNKVFCPECGAQQIIDRIIGTEIQIKIHERDIKYLVDTTGCTKKVARMKIKEACDLYLVDEINNELLYRVEREIKEEMKK